MRFRRSALLIASCYLLSCVSPVDDAGADLHISVLFPKGKSVGAHFIDPRTRCVSVEVFSDDRSFHRSAVLSPQSPRASFEDIPVRELTVEVRATDGELSADSCGGALLDYATARVSLQRGENALSLTMLRAEWVFKAPVSLNSTLPGSTERLTGFALFDYPLRSGFSGFDRYSVLFRGSDLNNCRSGSGVTCYTQVDYALHLRNGHETVGTVGVEFKPYPDQDTGWVRLSPGTGGERYFVLISSPPCSYRTPANLISCDFSSTVSLEDYMGTTFDQGELRGFVWEVMLLSQPTFSRKCFWDRDLTDPFPCPVDLTEPEPTPPYSGASGPPKGSPSGAGAVFRDVRAELRKVYRFSSAKYAACNAAGECDYNLDGAIDSGDDTNSDGVIDHRDSREFFAEFSWSMSFDLATHPFEAEPAPLGRLIESHFFLWQNDNPSSPVSSLIPVDYNGTVKDPLTDAALFEFLIWAFGGYDLRTGRYYAYHPRWLIYYDRSAGEYRLVDAITLRTVDTLRIEGYICDLILFTDPFEGVGHIFYLSDGADCTTGNFTAFYLNTRDRVSVKLGGLLFDPGPFVFHEPVVYSDRPDRYVTGFLGLTELREVQRCDTPVNCKTLLTNVERYAPVGFHFGMRRAFLIANNRLYHYDPRTSTLDPEKSDRPVTDCTLSSDTVYCHFLDPVTGSVELYRFDTEDFALVPIGKITEISPDAGVELYTTRDYIVVGYTDTSFAFRYSAVPKKGGDPQPIEFSGYEPYLTFSSTEGVYGHIRNAAGLCWVSNDSIGKGSCVQDAYLPSDPEGFPQHLPRVNGSFGEHPVERIAAIVASSGCVGSMDCTGGGLYIYTPDMKAGSPVGSIADTHVPEAVYGTDELFLVSFMDVRNVNNPSNPAINSFIHTVLPDNNPTMRFSGRSGQMIGVVDEIPELITP